MSNPGEFLQACADGKIWLFCSKCNEEKNINDVEHIDCIGNENYWGSEPWWHDTRVFNCRECGTRQESQIEYVP
ncbi:MAG: hypothetical protein KAT62_05940 [Desulfuromonadales bacterium]|nr:hypothetical protein [Desulfuromonadales bacterium]